jgi:hypothetical protein
VPGRYLRYLWRYVQDQMRDVRDVPDVPDALQSSYLCTDVCGYLRGDVPNLSDTVPAEYLRSDTVRAADLPHLCDPVRHLCNSVQPEYL